MKRIFLCFCLAVIAGNINAQVGIGTATPDASAQLEINSNNKGLLIPRVAQANLLSAPATSLLVYQTNNPAGFYYFDGASWQLLAAANNMWGLNGNAATISSNFVGTTDAQPLRFKVNNQQAGLIDMDVANGATFLGYNTGISNTAGFNTAFGFRSLFSNTGGTRNTAAGYAALYSNNTASDNTAYGYEALRINVSGIRNTAMGSMALRENTGSDNTATGNAALQNTAGNQNTGTGSYALRANTSGVGNTAIGFSSSIQSATGNRNTALGGFSLSTNTTGNNNTAIGYDAGPSVGALTNSTAIGYNAKVAQSNSLILGGTAADAVQVGIGNTAPNASAQLEITSTNKGILIPRILQANRPASPATGLLIYQTDGTPGFYYYDGITWSLLGGKNWGLSGNTGTTSADFIGTADAQPLRFKVNGQKSGLIEFTADANTAFGNQALSATTSGKGNVANGYLALSQNLTGNDNTAIGTEALYANTAAHYNTAVGRYALYATLANNNTAVGYSALSANTTGEFNVAVGNFTLNSNSTGINNTAIGYNAGPNVDGLFNTTCIGNGARVSNANKVRIGNTAVTAIEGQVAYTIASDKRFKFNIQEDVKGLDFILKLRPVTYQFDSKLMDQFSNVRQIAFASYDADAEKSFKEAATIRRTGLIAQEVEKAANETQYDFDGIIKPKSDKDYYTLSYATLVVPLIKAVQEQQQTIEQLKNRLEKIEVMLKK